MPSLHLRTVIILASIVNNLTKYYSLAQRFRTLEKEILNTIVNNLYEKEKRGSS